MSDFKGTKGPWIVRDQEIQSVGTEGSMTAMCYVLENARLIAAAPELLEALQWAMKKIGPYRQRTNTNADYCDAVDKANASIAKALGQ